MWPDGSLLREWSNPNYTERVWYDDRHRNMKGWEQALARWRDAGLLTPEQFGRILAFEADRAPESRLRWPVLFALAFGGLLLAAGILLFVSAHWDELSPTQRFSLVLAMVGGLHLAGAFTAERFPLFATTMHAVGSIALGAGIFLSGQIFHLAEHWPGGVMLWALGAVLAWALLRDQAQFALAAVLVPAWLMGEWTVAWPSHDILLAQGVLLWSLAYLGSDVKSLHWIGGLALPLAAIAVAVAGTERGGAAAWVFAFAVPLVVGGLLLRREAWVLLLWALWVAILPGHPSGRDPELPFYLLCAVGSIGLVAWGLRLHRSHLINWGVAAFSITVFTFYFSSVMDKLGRAASMVGLGILFLAGGWLLERLRRQLVARIA